MHKIKVSKNGKDWILILIFYILLLQNPLESVLSVFKYTDEIFGMFGIGCMCYRGIRRGRIALKKSNGKIILALLIFFLAGILGNLIYRYQPASAVLEDLYVNMKFFLAIISGYELFRNYGEQRAEKTLAVHARFMAVVFFVMLLMDQFFQVFPSPETRYGLRVSQLIYGHATYLAGAMVFLLSVLTAFYSKKNNLYIAMCLVVLFFTLRGKAVAGVAAYILIAYFLIYYRKKLRFWHVIVIAAVAVIIAWDQIYRYYIELEGQSARSALTLTSFQISKDYFPIGTGFGTFASNVAADNYSPVYYQYGLSVIHGLAANNISFGSDTFWPIIIGQTGLIGTVCYIYVLITLFRRVLKVRTESISAYATGIFIFCYLMISSTSEPTFCNSVSVPLAMMIGYIFVMVDRNQKVTKDV